MACLYNAYFNRKFLRLFLKCAKDHELKATINYKTYKKASLQEQDPAGKINSIESTPQRFPILGPSGSEHNISMFNVFRKIKVFNIMTKEQQTTMIR